MTLQPVTVDSAPSSLASCTFHPNVSLSFQAGVRPWSRHHPDLNFSELRSSLLPHTLVHFTPLPGLLYQTYLRFPDILYCVGSVLWEPLVTTHLSSLLSAQPGLRGGFTPVLPMAPSKCRSSCSSFLPLASGSGPGPSPVVPFHPGSLNF